MDYVEDKKVIEGVSYIKLSFDKHKYYSDCNLCTAIQNEPNIYCDKNITIIKNKYSIFDKSKLIISRNHGFNQSLVNFYENCQKYIKENEIALINATNYCGVKNHLHAEIINLSNIKEHFLKLVIAISDQSPTTNDSAQTNTFITKDKIYKINSITNFLVKPLTCKECLGYVASHKDLTIQSIKNLGYINYLFLNIDRGLFIPIFNEFKVYKDNH